jgi:uncharacterized short protein YbdD (DUF466 family)
VAEVVARALRTLRSFSTAARHLWLGVSGLHTYESYVAHLREHHAERPIPSRQEFFRREFVERWNGVRRCC